MLGWLHQPNIVNFSIVVGQTIKLFTQVRGSQAKLAMRPKPGELQHHVVRFTVNQHQDRFDVTIPMILPVTGQRVDRVVSWPMARP